MLDHVSYILETLLKWKQDIVNDLVSSNELAFPPVDLCLQTYQLLFLEVPVAYARATRLSTGTLIASFLTPISAKS